MKYEKPITENAKEKVNALYLFLKGKNDFVSKDEIGAYLGVKNERTVRDIISLLSHKKPIISNSKGLGYKLALTKEDLEMVELTWKEIDSRIEELEKRRKPLVEFCEKAKSNLVFKE